MSPDKTLRILAFGAILPAAAPLYFFLFWRFYGYFRRRPVLMLALVLLSFAVVGVPVYCFRRAVFALRLDFPPWVRALGWVFVIVWSVIGLVADRQLGARVRAFGPHFEAQGRIRLRTSGAYGIVRHPIYAAGLFFMLGTFLATGYPAVLAACAVFTLGALWFTRREEERTMALLDDPAEYLRYRERVPALFPLLGRVTMARRSERST